MDVIRLQSAVLHSGSDSESRAESCDSRALPEPDPLRTSTFGGRTTSSRGC